MQLNPQATELNAIINKANPHVMTMLSERGKAMFFPKKGILSQSAQAVGKEINATIGTALEDDNSPMCLPTIASQISLPKGQMFPYAPSFGKPDIRAKWKEMLTVKNPSLAGIPISLPVVTSALTHGLSMAGYLFVDPNDSIILPDLYWENYDLLFENAFGGSLATYPLFSNKRFNLAGLHDHLAMGPIGKKIVLLNFPNNPTGYTPTIAEIKAINEELITSAEKGNSIVTLIDDAYFGLVFKEENFSESIFTLLAKAHERILAVKFDGPTKEDYVWGFRVGFITFGIKNGTAELYNVLEAKLGGAIRGNISNASNIAQSLLVAAWEKPEYAQEKQRCFDTLKRRYTEICRILADNPHYSEVFEALPFNSGYFMCVRPKIDAEVLQKVLLDKYSTGVIALFGCLRIAFSSTPLAMLPKLFENIYRAGKEIV